MKFVIHRLILKEWFRFFFGAFFVLFLLVTIANLISGFLRPSITTQEAIFGYLFEIPTFLNMILPISCLVASIFAINKLKNRNELTAIFASGFSRKKFISIIFLGSLLVGLSQFWISAFGDPILKQNRHLIFEEANERLRAFRAQGLKASTIGSGRVWYKTTDYFFSFVAFDRSNNSLKEVDLYYFSEDQLLTKLVKAAEAVHLYENAWKFRDVSIIDYLGTPESPTLSRHKELNLIINESAEDFEQIESDVTTLTPFALKAYINRLNSAGINTSEYTVLYLNKFSSSMICIIFGLMASIGLFNPNRRNSSLGQSLAFVFVFTLLYWLVYSYTLELGNSGKLQPLISTFGVPALFGAFILTFFARNRRLR
jgi:lipopolysaccharide export system permease protein